jgi:general secretion pathway protein E
VTSPASPLTLAEFSLAEGISREYLVHNGICPLGYTPEGELRIATAARPEGTDRPDRPARSVRDAIDDLSIAYDRPVRLEVVPADEVERLIERLVNRTERAIELADGSLLEDDLTADVRDLANQPPVIRYVNLLVRDAYDAGASDIHLESSATGIVVRFRLDGILSGAPEPPTHLHHAIVSRIKLLAEMDIAERRRPQDGRIRVRLEDRDLDLRVSTVPTMYGESVVVRLLDRGGRPVRLDELGMPPAIEARVRRLASLPHGMVLVTGPTGSGKTTTLYASLGLRDVEEEKIVTVEDPIEYNLPGVTQMPVNRQAGMTFAKALPYLVRQDPNVIMIGEMRDAETAEIATQAAMTGHIVFSTLHTNDALGAIPRLRDLGVPEYLIAATLEGVLAQRLVRRVCDRCAEPYRPPAGEIGQLVGDDTPEPYAGGPDHAAGPDVEGQRTAAGRKQPEPGMEIVAKATDESGEPNFLRGVGCPACRGTGYRGRIALFELVEMTDALRAAIVAHASHQELGAIAAAGSMSTLQADAWEKVRSGQTTVEEVLRVLKL